MSKSKLMLRQKSKSFIAFAMGVCMLSAISLTSCDNEKESSTETTITDSLTVPAIDTPAMMTPIDTTIIDTTGTTRPIVPGT